MTAKKYSIVEKFENLSKNEKSFVVLSLIFSFFLIVGSFSTFSKIQTGYSLEQFLPPDDPVLKIDDQLRKTFQINNDAPPFVLILKLKNETWLTPRNINWLAYQSEKAAGFSSVKKVISLPHIESVIASDDGIEIGKLLESVPPQEWSEKVLKNNLLTPALISKDGKTVSVIIEPNLNLSQEQNLKLYASMRELSAEIRQNNIEAHLGGVPAVQIEVNELLKSELKHFILLSYLMCFLLLRLVFMQWGPILIAFVVSVLANVLTISGMALLGYHFTVLSTTIPILTTVSVVSICLHSFMRIAEERAHYREEQLTSKFLILSFKKLFMPNLLSVMTTAIGFLSLLSAKAPLLSDYGISVAFAMVMAWISFHLLSPALLLLTPDFSVRAFVIRGAKWSLWIPKYKHVLVYSILGVAVILGIKGQNLSWKAQLLDDLPEKHEIAESNAIIDKQLGGTLDLSFEIIGKKESWSQAGSVKKLEHFMMKVRKLPLVSQAVGLPDFLKVTPLHQKRSVASTNISVPEMIFMHSMSAESPLKKFINADASKTRVAVRIQDLPSNKILELQQSILTQAKKEFPDYKIQVGGMGSTVHKLNNSLSKELIFGFWQSMVFIFVVLIFVFRSVKWALIACVPNLVPPAFLLGILAITETPIKPSVAIIFSIALGLAFNNTVYYLQRLKSINKGSVKARVRKALWQEANPCLVSSLIVIGGFAVFMASYFQMNKIFGFYMIVSLFAGLLGDLILLPALLSAFPQLISSNNKERVSMEKVFASVVGLVFLFISYDAQALTSEQIKANLKKNYYTDSEEIEVDMQIIEADSSKSDRLMVLKRMSKGDDQYFLSRIKSPKDVKGTALLATYKNSKDDVWIYLPTSKQTRRINVKGAASGGILGSELSAEDFNFSNADKMKITLKGQTTVSGQKVDIVESDVSKSSKIYSKVIFYLSADKSLIIRADSFDKKQKPAKVLEFSEYVQDKNIFRPKKIKIMNTQNKRGTVVTISKFKANPGYKESQFTPGQLAND